MRRGGDKVVLRPPRRVFVRPSQSVRLSLSLSYFLRWRRLSPQARRAGESNAKQTNNKSEWPPGGRVEAGERGQWR